MSKKIIAEICSRKWWSSQSPGAARDPYLLRGLFSGEVRLGPRGADPASHTLVLYGGWAAIVFAENSISLLLLVSELSDLASQEQKKVLDGSPI